MIEPEGECWRWVGAAAGSGYPVVSFQGRNYYVHRLMCWLWHGDCEPGQQAMHSCNHKWCVNPLHLSWGTALENNRQAWDDGLCPIGERHGRSFYSDALVKEVKRRLAQGQSQRVIADAVGMSQGNVSRIKRGRTRRFVLPIEKE